eukprot:TRINITY_DN10490_c0_g1_i1.p3 TRINITY_DN10490_c0_g1~~TRINITY_DN10490_c0_g1_i1.p3  ORF type:complete len:100 (+),score=40.73 TRINITY_DN10490_c0_g1_i1:81-380(+)
MGVITDAFSQTVGVVAERVYQVYGWARPHIWQLSTMLLVLSVPFVLVSEVDKNKLMHYNGRLGDRLEQDKKDTSQQELTNKLCDMDTGMTSRRGLDDFD